MQPELLSPLESQIIIGQPQLVEEDVLLEQALGIMQTERISNGGNIRDKTIGDLQALVASGGQIWGWVEGRNVISVCTLEPFVGDHPWWYLNNGVTKPEARGLGLSGRLIASAIRSNDKPGVGFIVIYVRQGLFERLGFQEVTVPQLALVDEKLARIIGGKLRPGKESHVFIRTVV